MLATESLARSFAHDDCMIIEPAQARAWRGAPVGLSSDNSVDALISRVGVEQAWAELCKQLAPVAPVAVLRASDFDSGSEDLTADNLGGTAQVWLAKDGQTLTVDIADAWGLSDPDLATKALVLSGALKPSKEADWAPRGEYMTWDGWIAQVYVDAP